MCTVGDFITPYRQTWETELHLDGSDRSGDEAPLTAHEGTLVYRLHRVRERSAAFRAAVKARRLAAQGDDGGFRCEACGFDFVVTYGAAAVGFIEAHHVIPLSTLPRAGAAVSASDIALLCANCHRMAHRTGCHTVKALKELLAMAGETS